MPRDTAVELVEGPLEADKPKFYVRLLLLARAATLSPSPR
jgi:hypothetical protein